MRSALAALAAMTLTLVAGCDSPLVPGRFDADVYDFALPSTPPAILRWPAGKTIRVFIGTGAGHDRLLQESFTAGALEWNALAWFGEFRVTAASAPHAADVVLAWSESIDDIVDTSSCQPAFTRAVTTFCVDGLGTDTAHLRRFPLAQTNATSEVKMVVTLLEIEALQPERARRLVAHELGHVLGIGQHSPNPLDLMFRTDPTAPRPSVRDAATVQVLYHVRADILP